MSGLQGFLKSLLFTPDDTNPPPGIDITIYQQPWGFTVYRTAYGPSTETNWDSLIWLIKAQVEKQVRGPYPRAIQDIDLKREVISHFHLDIRSDVNTLDRLDVDQLRKMYRDQAGGQPMNADPQSPPQRRVFLLIDEDVIDRQAQLWDKTRDEFWVKCVEADYVASDHQRDGGQEYFGWMKVELECVPQLWNILSTKSMSEIAPPVREGKVPGVLSELGEFW